MWRLFLWIRFSRSVRTEAAADVWLVRRSLWRRNVTTLYGYWPVSRVYVYGTTWEKGKISQFLHRATPFGKSEWWICWRRRRSFGSRGAVARLRTCRCRQSVLPAGTTGISAIPQRSAVFEVGFKKLSKPSVLGSACQDARTRQPPLQTRGPTRSAKPITLSWFTTYGQFVRYKLKKNGLSPACRRRVISP